MAYEDEYEDIGGIEQVLGPERIRQLLMTLRGAPPELQRAAIMKEAQEVSGRAPGMQALQQAAPEAFPQPMVAAAPGIRGEAGSYGGSPAPPPGPPVGGPPVEQAKKGFLESIDWDRVNKAISFLGSAGLMASNRPGMRQLGSMSLANDYNTQQQALAAKQEQQIYQQRLSAQQQQEQWKAQQADEKARRAQAQMGEGWTLINSAISKGMSLPEVTAIGAQLGIKPDDMRQLYESHHARETLVDQPSGQIRERRKYGPGSYTLAETLPRSAEIKGVGENVIIQQPPGQTTGGEVPQLPGFQAPVPISGQVSFYRPEPKPEKSKEMESTAQYDAILSSLTGGKITRMADPAAAPYHGQVIARANQLQANVAAASRPTIQYQADVAYAQTAAREAAQLDQPLGQDAVKWVEKSGSGGYAPPDMTARQAQQSGKYVPTTPAMQQSAASAQAALKILDEYDELAGRLLVKGTGKAAADALRVQSNRGALQLKRLAGDPDARRFDGLQGTLSTIARATGDTANIAVEEKKILQRALPSEGDTQQSAIAVSQQMRRVLQKIIQGKGLPIPGGEGGAPTAAERARRRPNPGIVVIED